MIEIEKGTSKKASQQSLRPLRGRRKRKQEGSGEAVIKDRKAMMLLGLSEVQNRLKALQRRYIKLLDTLRQLETENRAERYCDG